MLAGEAATTVAGTRERAVVRSMKLVLVMIVRNEARGIERTLQSVRDHIDGWLILDTGSTDGTQTLARKSLAGIEGRLVEEPFVDFSTTRNRALDLAEEMFGAGTWCLMMSGDQVVEHADSIQWVAKRADADGYQAVSLDIRSGGLDYVQTVLTKAGTGCAYTGVTHEVLIAPRTALARDLQTNAPRIVNTAPVEDKTARWKLDVALLEADRAKNPDPRTTFYLAQSYECLGDYERAAQLYTERADDEGGYWEERFIAMLRTARCYWRLKRPASQVIRAYEFAHAFCPERAEPLNDLAKYLWELGAPIVAHGVAKKAAALPWPKNSTLFIERPVYEHEARARFHALDRMLYPAPPARECKPAEPAVHLGV